MKTKVIRMNPQELDMEGIREAGEILRQGGLVAFPTDMDLEETDWIRRHLLKSIGRKVGLPIIH